MNVDPEFARWLREGAHYAAADDAEVAAVWAELARVSEIMSPLATGEGAAAEAVRQLAFLSGPLVIDQHLVDGARVDLIGLPVILKNPRLGYEAGAAVFVIGVQELEEVEQSRLTVVRKLA